jgi:hypothetical protein
MIMNQNPPYWLNTQSNEFRRFMHLFVLMSLVALLMLLPSLSYANSGGGGFTGHFGPDQSLVTNTANSLKGWWKAFATWGLWLSIIAFAASVLFLKGQWWWIPVVIMLICLFGEKSVMQVASWAGLNG